MTTLHAATLQVVHALDNLDPETGELPAEFESARALVESKSVACVAWIIDSEADAEYVEKYAHELLAQVKSRRSRVAWIKKYLLDSMAALGITKIQHERGLFTATRYPERDESVEVLDEAQIPDEYMATKIVSNPNKLLIKAAIKAGTEVPGTRLVARDRLTVA